MRVIYRDAWSIYNSRYMHYLASTLETNYSFLIFDNGRNAYYDSITGPNRCIRPASTYTRLNRTVFLKY